MDVIASGKALGAEVRGVDLSKPWTAETKAFVEQAWRDHLVLLFRGQSIGDEHLLAMADALGGQQSTGSRAYWLEAGYGAESGRVSALPGISIISNLDENGKPAMKHAGSGSQELLWHTDNSYVDSPPKGSILHALQVPVDGGGHTSFANQYLAYDSLPEATKAKIAGLHTKQDASRNTAGGAPSCGCIRKQGGRRSIWAGATQHRPAISSKCRTRRVRRCWMSCGRLRRARNWCGPMPTGRPATC